MLNERIKFFEFVFEKNEFKELERKKRLIKEVFASAKLISNKENLSDKQKTDLIEYEFIIHNFSFLNSSLIIEFKKMEFEIKSIAEVGKNYLKLEASYLKQKKGGLENEKYQNEN